MAPKIITLVLLYIFLRAAGAYAECDICKAANQQTSSHYLDFTGARLLQGVTNVAFSWLELGLQPVKASAQAKKGECPFNVGLAGAAHGLGSAGYRIVEGSGEILTAFWPQRVLAPAECEVCHVEEMKSQGIVS